MSEINTELGRSSTATISLDTAESGGYATINLSSPSYPSDSRPASISEWYSYDHSAASGYSGTISRDNAPADTEACGGLNPVDTVYKDGSGSAPQSGDQLYTNAALTTDFSPTAGFGYWYKYEDVDGGNIPYAIYLLQGASNECVIESVVAC